MKKSDLFKQKRASKMEEMNTLIGLRKTEEREFTEAEETQFDTLEGEIRALDVKIEREEKIEKAETRAASMAASIGNQSLGDGEGEEKRVISERASITKAIRSAVAQRSLDGAEKEMNEIALEENRNAKVETPDNALVNIPLSFLRATAQTVSEDSGSYGGALVVSQAPRVQMGFTPASILETLGVSRLRGLSGGDLPLPVASDYAFAWLTETAAITPQKKTITGPTLSPNRLGAAVQISNRLIAQSSIDVEALVRAKIISGYESAINVAAINGSGASNQPEGLLNNSSVQTGTSTDADIPTKALVAELVKLVMAANSTTESLAFLGSAATKYLLETTELSSSTARYIMEKAGELQGQRFMSSSHVPQLSSNEVLIFGDWSQLFVGEWGALSVLPDPYTGALSNSLQLILNAHADVAIAQPNAFAFNKWFNAVDTP